MNVVFLNQTRLMTYGGELLTPDSTFPYHRLASTIGKINATSSYLYHQLDASINVEDAWDGRVDTLFTSPSFP